jgi:hypothetical protein
MDPPEFLLEFKIKSEVRKASLIWCNFRIATQVSRHAYPNSFFKFFFTFDILKVSLKELIYSPPTPIQIKHI